MDIPPSMEMNLIELGVIKSDMVELESIVKQVGFHTTKADIKDWHKTLIIDGKVMF